MDCIENKINSTKKEQTNCYFTKYKQDQFLHHYWRYQIRKYNLHISTSFCSLIIPTETRATKVE